MRLLAFAFIGAVTISAAAAAEAANMDTVDIKIKLSVGETVVSRPAFRLALGQTGTLTQPFGHSSAYRIDVTPTLTRGGAVQMSFHVIQIVNGDAKLLASPQIVTPDRAPASIEQRTLDGTTDLRLSITPTLN